MNKNAINMIIIVLELERRRRLRKVYDGMKTRCYNKNAINHERYGARGIFVCDEWRNSFSAFYAWSVKNGYRDGWVLDRKDNNGPYSPENCRWVTYGPNMQNCRIRVDNRTGYPGVQKRRKRYRAALTMFGHCRQLGTYDTPEEAYSVYRKAKDQYIAYLDKMAETA